VFVEFEEGGGAFEVVLLAVAALDLDGAELVERFLAAGVRRSASSSGTRLSRQAVLASSWTNWRSVGVLGSHSARNCSQWIW